MKTSQLKMKPALAALCAGLLLVPCPASEHDFDTLFEDREDTRDVNEGGLVFLPAPPDGVVHAHTTRITLTDDALRDGWAGLYQCHHHIDQVSAAQIVYNTERIRNLEGTSRRDGGSHDASNVEARKPIHLGPFLLLARVLSGRGSEVRARSCLAFA
mgnify:CR=1 FL=1